MGRLQFSLLELLVFVTVSAVTFGLIGMFGGEGFWERLDGALFLASPVIMAMEVLYWGSRQEE